MSNIQQLWSEAQNHARNNRWELATERYNQVVRMDPGFVPAWVELSHAHAQQGHYKAARDAILGAASVTANIPPMTGMVVAMQLRRYEEIPRLFEYIASTRLAERLPAEKLVDLAMFVSRSAGHPDAIGWVDKAIELSPGLAEAHYLRGMLHMFSGERELATHSFERAIALKPALSSAYSVLSRAARVDRTTNHIDLYRKRLSMPSLTANDRAHLGYALHNELHELGDYGQAWDALELANRAKKSLQPYDHAATLRLFEALKQHPPLPPVTTPRDQDATEQQIPIFIIGMHRSGTTLVERMLSGHAEIADAGETNTFPAQLRLAADRPFAGVIDLQTAEMAMRLDFPAIGAGFMRGIMYRSEGKRFITEKLNPNFIVSGLIARALPQAKLLHMRRNAVDTCFSNLRTLFAGEVKHTYDMLDIADYFKSYSDLMSHWERSLPGRVFNVEYQDLVLQPEGTVQRIAQHVGFDYQGDMLDVGRKSGIVTTASANQVRSGILPNRDGAWKAYASQLQPMLDRLAQHGLA